MLAAGTHAEVAEKFISIFGESYRGRAAPEHWLHGVPVASNETWTYWIIEETK